MRLQSGQVLFERSTVVFLSREILLYQNLMWPVGWGEWQIGKPLASIVCKFICWNTCLLYTLVYQDLLDQEEALPKWFVTGRTTLIMKSPDKGPVVSNYRPITCLPTTWKLLSGILADKLIHFLDETNIMAPEQKGTMPGGRGSKTRLLIDKMICLDSKCRRINLTVAWIDFQKAFDSVPHSWILEVLSMYRVNSTLKHFIATSMNLWNTMLTVNDLLVGNGIFQGDSLSPLLFCMALNPYFSQHIMDTD